MTAIPTHADTIEQTIHRKVLAHITEHPRLTSMQISEALDIPYDTVRSMVSRLNNDGLVRRVRVPGQRQLAWERGSEDAEKVEHGHPRQSTVDDWEPHHARDPLVSALFGSKQQ